MQPRPLRPLADALAYTVSPLALPVFGFTLGGVALGAGRGEAWLIGAVALLGHGLVPLAFLVAYVRRGAARTIEVRQRRQRTLPYLFGAGCVAATAIAFFVLLPPARRPLAWIEGVQALNTLGLLLINLRWKISLHLTALAATMGILGGLAWGAPLARPGVLPPAIFAVLALLVPALAWARVYAGAHTAAQTLGGTLFGLGLVPLEMLLLRALGLLG